MMNDIKKRMETGYATRIVIENHQDPSDGSISMSATVSDWYTNEELAHLGGYYDFGKLMNHLNRKIKAL